MARGTQVEARNLFFNLPARRKFLRREQTELGHCADVVTKQALAHPEVSFKLLHNQREMLNLRREKGLAERTAALLGRSFLRDMQPIDNQDPVSELRIHGLLGQPSLNRSTTSHVYTFINGRYIRDRVVQHAIMEGYRHLLMKGRFPVAVLFVEIAADKVDVNVHPTKHEVRFREQSMVHDFIARSLQQSLKPATWVTKGETAPSEGPPPGTAERLLQAEENTIQPLIRESTAQNYHRPANTSIIPDSQGVEVLRAFEKPPQATSQPVNASEFEQRDAGRYFSGLRYLGQYHNSYLLCQDGDDLLLIDQHAAHERIGFERLKDSFLAGQIEQQTLLFPEMLEIDFRSSDALAAHLPEIARLGFDVEPFGGRSYAIKAVPQLLVDSDVKKLVLDIALDLDQTGSSGALEEKLDDVLILMACHSVIRANQALEVREARALLEQLDEVDFKANCPHGRPVSQRLTLREIERMFRRL